MNRIIDVIEKEQEKGDMTPFSVGDSVRVHTRVVEGDKERIQIFTGVVIGRKGRGLNETFTVRRISYGDGGKRVTTCRASVSDAIRWRFTETPYNFFLVTLHKSLVSFANLPMISGDV